MTYSASNSFIDDFKTIPEMLVHAVATWPEREAFRQFDYDENTWISLSWKEYGERVLRWRRAFHALGYRHGDRVAMLLTNCIDAVTFDQSAMANALVPVPLHAIDTPGSSAYILHDSDARFLITTSLARWNAIVKAAEDSRLSLDELDTVVIINEVIPEDTVHQVFDHKVQVMDIEKWLLKANAIAESELPAGPTPDDLCELIYTSGTTGRPKGVMITHSNIAANIQQINGVFDFSENDVFLSFLPFSHTFERTVTHYNSLANGSTMAFSRGVAQILNDFHDVKPTVVALVPRVFEMVYQHLQTEIRRAGEEAELFAKKAVAVGWRRFCAKNDLPIEGDSTHDNEINWPSVQAGLGAKVLNTFGGRIRVAIAGGAALNYDISKFFCAMELPVHQGYGLTETSPILCFTRKENNHPLCVGHPLPDTQVKVGELDELLIKGPQVMKGYWKRPDATEAAFVDGWFRTGDQAALSDGGRVRIKGRIKEIIVTSTGEKIAPVDVEFAIQSDHLFQQVMVLGDNHPYITAIVVVNPALWEELCQSMELEPNAPETLNNHDVQRTVIKRIRHAARNIPQYGIPRVVAITREPWTIDNGLLTPTMKLRRPQILEHYADLIETLYK